MQEEKAISYLNTHKELLIGAEECDSELLGALAGVSDEFLPVMERLPLKQPSVLQLIAVFPGVLGVDRLMLGDIKGALLKYITFGGFGIWWVLDIVSAKKRCRAYNCRKLREAINDPSVAKDMLDKEARAKRAFAIAKAVGPELVKGISEIQKTNYVN